MEWKEDKNDLVVLDDSNLVRDRSKLVAQAKEEARKEIEEEERKKFRAPN